MANSANRYGPRYGRRLKNIINKVEEKQKGKVQCPHCHYETKMTRHAAGIWECNKCHAKFSGRAYSIN